MIEDNKRDKMKVLVVEPLKEPYIKEIDTGLKSLQNEVGGNIQAIYPFEEEVAIICNEEGKINGLELNRALRDENGKIYDIIAGTFLVCGLTYDNFGSLTDELINQFSDRFKEPETFIQIGRDIIAIPVESQMPHDLYIKNNDGIINFGDGTNTIIHAHIRQTENNVNTKKGEKIKPSVKKTLEQGKKEQDGRGQPKLPEKLSPEL